MHDRARGKPAQQHSYNCYNRCIKCTPAIEMNETCLYTKGDIRRVLSVLGAIAVIPDPTMLKIAVRTGLDKRSVMTSVERAREQLGVTVDKVGTIYRMVDWGPFINRDGALRALEGALLSAGGASANESLSGPALALPAEGPAPAAAPGAESVPVPESAAVFGEDDLELGDVLLDFGIMDEIGEESAAPAPS